MKEAEFCFTFSIDLPSKTCNENCRYEYSDLFGKESKRQKIKLEFFVLVLGLNEKKRIIALDCGGGVHRAIERESEPGERQKILIFLELFLGNHDYA